MVRTAFRRSRNRGACLGVAVVALVASALASPLAASAATAEPPRWQLQAVPTPTNLTANAPRDQVQTLSVEATAGTFTLEVHVPGYGETQYSPPIAYDATAAELETALVNVAGLSESTVSVSGGPGTATSHEYTITFEGKAGDQPVPLMRAQTKALTGSAEVTEAVKGALAPELILTATNVGGEATNGSAITVRDSLPSWLEATGAVGYDMWKSGFGSNRGGLSPMSCTTEAHHVECTYTGGVDSGDQLMIYVKLVSGSSAAGGVTNSLSAVGGGAPEASIATSLPVSTSPASFGPAPGSVFAQVSTHQAGAHPSVVTSFWMNTAETGRSANNPKDVRFDLPPGLVGSTVGMPRCSMERVIAGGKREAVKVCPNDTMVGVAEVTFGSLGTSGETLSFDVPIYDIEPSPGEPAAFAFDAILLPVRLDTTVLSNGNYGVRVTAPDLNESESVIGSTITIWGVPAQHSGAGTNGERTFTPPYTFGGEESTQTAAPLLTNPQQCGKQMVATMSTDPWVDQGAFESVPAPMGSLSGCLQVPFSSSFTFLPDTLEAGAPAGYTFTLNVPQQNTPETLASSSVRHVSLALPEGVVVNPSAAWGLKACSSAQFYGPHHPSQEPAELAECPREAQVGEVEVESPDLQHPLKGQVYLGAPECDPCTPQQAEDGEMVRLFVQLVGEGEAGIIVKLEGRAEINQTTGQLTTVFEETPEVPFSRMKFVLEGGPRAVLANPRTCGTVKTSGVLTPWSSEPGISNSTPSYEFAIDQNCHGPEFHPTFKAGMPNIQAGEYGEFTLAFGRPDNSEMLKSIETHMPPGLMGSLDGVALCGQAQANAGECAAASQIGEAEVLTGPGADPYLVKGGHVYLTEGYGGAPFGLSIVVPAVAGPYTLAGTTGNGTVVVRAQIFVNDHTGQLTVVSGEMPSMLDGIPLQLKAVNVRINRPHFMFNPTSCNKMKITGTIDAVEGLSANVESPFQVTNCARLPFHPKFSALTHARHTRKAGAYLHVVMKSSHGQANIREVHVELPTALPSELPTLQKACTERQFAANPAGCPAESVVGHASIRTPLVPVPLTGPAYFVSHGGAEFPELVMVLQGYGITVILNGETFIAKSEVTSSTFKSVPDVPFSRFDLVLPTGTHPALAGNGNFCSKKLIMPTRIVAQSGKVMEQSSRLMVTGCRPEIEVRKHHVHGGKARIVVQVPSAGKLIATGKGIGRAVKRVTKHGGRVAIGVRLKRHVRRMLRHRRHRRLRVTVHLKFKPRHGKKIAGHVRMLMR